MSKGPSTLATLFSHRWPRFCGGDIYSRRKQLFSSFGEHTAVCGSSVRQAVARHRHRQSVCIHNIHVAATCRPSVLGSATKTRPPVAKQSGQCARALTCYRPITSSSEGQMYECMHTINADMMRKFTKCYVQNHKMITK